MSDNAYGICWWTLLMIGVIVCSNGQDGYDLIDSLSIWLRK